MLRRGYPRLKLMGELATKFPGYTFRVLATFDHPPGAGKIK